MLTATLSIAVLSDSFAATSAQKSSSQKAKAARDAQLSAQAEAERITLVQNANIIEERIQTGNTLYGDKRLDAYVQSIADKLYETLGSDSQQNEPKQSFRVRVRTSPEPIVTTLPNGAIYISYGLIGRLQSESQLALILGSEMSRCVQNAESREAVEIRSRSLRTLFPNLLLITATAGMGALAIGDMDEKARVGYARELEIEADKLAVTMLLAAGYSGADAAQAFSRLASTQQNEGRAYVGRFSSATLLAARNTAVTPDIASRAPASAATTAASSTTIPGTTPAGNPIAEKIVTGNSTPANSASDNESFPKYQRTLSLMIAAEDLRDFKPGTARLVLDRYESELGADGRSQYVRAEAIRRNSTGPADEQSAIDAYVNATQLEGAVADAFKQLGFLYRKQGKQAEAKAAFSEYLKRQPDAIDAPIIATYL